MLADCIRLAQTNNEALEALLQKFAPKNTKYSRQLQIKLRKKTKKQHGNPETKKNKKTNKKK